MYEWEIERLKINKKIDEYIKKTNEGIDKALISQFKKLGIEIDKLKKGDIRKDVCVIEDIDRYYYKDILILEVSRSIDFDNKKFQYISKIKIPT